jgi:hypothetical protein
MVIGKQAAATQKGFDGLDAKALISNRKGVGPKCRLHHKHVVEAPVWVTALAGAEIRTAEAVQTFQSQYRSSGCESQGDSSRDLPQLQDGM